MDSMLDNNTELSVLQRTVQYQHKILQQQQAIIEQQGSMMQMAFRLVYQRSLQDLTLPAASTRTSSVDWRKSPIVDDALRMVCAAKHLFVYSPDSAAARVRAMQSAFLDANHFRYGCLVAIHDGIPYCEAFTASYSRLFHHPINRASNMFDLVAQGKMPMADPHHASFFAEVFSKLVQSPSAPNEHVCMFHEVKTFVHEGVLRSNSAWCFPFYNQANRAVSCLAILELHPQTQVPTLPVICSQACLKCNVFLSPSASASANHFRDALAPPFSSVPHHSVPSLPFDPNNLLAL